MNVNSRRFKAVDILLLLGAVLPLLGAILLKILTAPRIRGHQHHGCTDLL